MTTPTHLAGPRPTLVYVVPCGAAKAPAPAPARQLYTAEHFRTTLATAEQLAAGDRAEGERAEVLILSALHGLVRPGQVIAPYDVTMGDPRSVTVPALAGQLADVDGGPGGATVYAFLPAAYRVRLEAAAERLCDEHDDLLVTVQDVYEGTRGIGEQRRVAAVVRRTC